jgi:hypothetical protein
MRLEDNVDSSAAPRQAEMSPFLSIYGDLQGCGGRGNRGGWDGIHERDRREASIFSERWVFGIGEGGGLNNAERGREITDLVK